MWLLFFVIVLVWGFNYLFVNVGLQSAGPLWLATLRAGFGAVTVVTLVTGLRQWHVLDARGRRDALLLGLPNTALFFGLWFVAAERVLPGLAAVVIYTFPLWVALLSAPVLGYRLAPLQWAAIAGGFVGVALISQIWLAAAGHAPILPILELVAAALAWAIGTVLFQRRFRREEMPEANAYQLIGGAIGLVVITLAFTPTPLPHFTVALWVAALWLGVLGTAIAYAIWFLLLGRTRAAKLSAYTFLVPVVALAASAVFFGERLSLVQLAGVGLVLLSIFGIARATDGRGE
jgi:probable blue pigment (indigoidine) exporter